METWVDLLQSKSSLKKSSKRKTRSTKALKHSPVKQEVLLVDYSPVNNDRSRDSSEQPNEIELLQLKLSQQQIVIAELTQEREHFLQQRIVDDTRLNVASHDLKESSLTELQLQGLRDALDQVTMEKSSVLTQLTVQRDEMTSLTNQLAEQQQRMVVMTTAKDQTSAELYSCKQSLEESLAETEQLRTELHRKEEELERHMDRSVELSVNVDKLRQQIAALSNPMDGNDSLHSKLVELSAHNVEIEKQSLSYQQDNMLLEQQLTSLQQANNNLKVRNSTLEDALIKAQLEIDSLNTKVASLDSSHHSEMLKLQQKLATSEEHISQLNEEKDQLASNIRQEVAHSNAMETEHSLLQAKYDQVIADKQLLEQELSMAQHSKVTDHDELLTQCKALRTELLEQTNSGVAMVTGLQQQLNEAKQIYDKLVSDYENCLRERDDVTSKLCTVSVANEQLTITNQKLLIQISDTDAELVKVKSDWMESCRKLNSAERDIKTLRNNCTELDKRLVTMESSTVVKLNKKIEELIKQIEELSNQLHQSNCYNEALQADKQAIESKLSELESVVNMKRSECMELQEHLNEMTMKCDQLLGDLHTSNASHMIQQQEISDLKLQLTELEQQISSKSDLTNEMNSLLVQRACRIEELENALASFDSAGALCNGESHQMYHKAAQTDTSWLTLHPVMNSQHIMYSTSSSSSSQSHLDCISSANSSPVQSVGDIPTEQLKAAELQCSELQQELTNQRVKFEQELANQRVKFEQEITNQKVKFEKELTNQFEQDQGAQFEQELTKQKVHFEQELTNQRLKYEQQVSLLNQQCKQDIVSSETSKQKEVSVLKGQIRSLQQALINQRNSLAGLVSNQVTNMASLRIEQSQVEEKSQLVKLVSDSQQQLVKVTEDKITQLITEVELLRTRKAIMKECSEQLEKSVVSEQEKSLQVKVDKLQHKVLRLHNHLKKRKSHCNYLRLRLGYVLAEVRLYKKLKSDLEGQISILQNGFEQSSRQHLACINLLEQARHMSNSVPVI